MNRPDLLKDHRQPQPAALVPDACPPCWLHGPLDPDFTCEGFALETLLDHVRRLHLGTDE